MATFPVPATPRLKQIGYGTGVSVYHLERSPKVGVPQSPWALKKVNKNMIQKVTYKDRLKKEGDILKTIDHPNIIGFRGFAKTEDGREVLAMEECTDCLGDLIENYKEMRLEPFEPHLIYLTIVGICKALDYLHTEKHLLHGDIKSYNILTKGDFEKVKLCDFGVSLELNDEGEASIEDYVGTSCWSAPEALNDGPITAKCDMFSLGLVVWEMLSLSRPHQDSFEDSSPVETALSDSEDSFNSSEMTYGTRPKLPDFEFGPEYSTIIKIFEWCTEEDFKKRPTAKELLQFLKIKGIEEG